VREDEARAREFADKLMRLTLSNEQIDSILRGFDKLCGQGLKLEGAAADAVATLRATRAS
jgi:hypothetical protein